LQNQRHGHFRAPNGSGFLIPDERTFWMPTMAGNRYTNNKGGCRMIVILRRPCLSNILLAFDPA